MTNSKSYHIRKVALLSSLFLFICSCQWKGKDAICKVGENILYADVLEQQRELFYPHLSKEEGRRKAIKRWVYQQQIALTMKKKFPDKQKENLLQSKENLKQLNLFDLENEYIKQNIDSTVSQKEIMDYYKQHRNNYKNKSIIVEALYIKAPDTIAEELHLKELYLLDNKEDIRKLESYISVYPISVYYEPKRWIYLDDLMREIPVSEVEKEQLAKTKKQAIYKVENEVHLINIFRYNTKTVSSPLEIEQKNIRNLILKKRAYELRIKATKTIKKNVKENYPVTYY